MTTRRFVPEEKLSFLREMSKMSKTTKKSCSEAVKKIQISVNISVKLDKRKKKTRHRHRHGWWEVTDQCYNRIAFYFIFYDMYQGYNSSFSLAFLLGILTFFWGVRNLLSTEEKSWLISDITFFHLNSSVFTHCLLFFLFVMAESA